MKILLTGASGYLGSLLVDSWLDHPMVEKIIAVDLKAPQFLFSKDHPKIHFIENNLADLNLEKELEPFGAIDAVVHAAYLIHTPYFKKNLLFHHHSNFDGAENAFKFSFRNNVKKLVHFSSVAVYGANPKNSLTHPFKEKDELKEETIRYGRDKKIIEKDLDELISRYKAQTEVFVLRIGSVAGPFGRFAKKGGLQGFFRGFLPFVPIVSDQSVRQFIHEDDVIAAVNFCLFGEFSENFLVFNLAPEGYLTFREITKILGKAVIRIPTFLASFIFGLVWHLSFGKIPTPPGVIRSYSFPLLVNGEKITSFGFRYDYNCLDAFLGLKGKFKELRLPRK